MKEEEKGYIGFDYLILRKDELHLREECLQIYKLAYAVDYELLPDSGDEERELRLVSEQAQPPTGICAGPFPESLPPELLSHVVRKVGTIYRCVRGGSAL